MERKGGVYVVEWTTWLTLDIRLEKGKRGAIVAQLNDVASKYVAQQWRRDDFFHFL